jgi:hypothetical protein
LEGTTLAFILLSSSRHLSDLATGYYLFGGSYPKHTAILGEVLVPFYYLITRAMKYESVKIGANLTRSPENGAWKNMPGPA